MKDLPQNMTEEISKLVTQEQNWLNRLKKSEDELEELQNRLGEIAENVSSKSDNKQVSHFQNMFDHYQIEVIRNLKHNVRLNIQDLSTRVGQNPEKYYLSFLSDLSDHKEKINQFFEYFDSMRHEFNTFAASTNAQATA